MSHNNNKNIQKKRKLHRYIERVLLQKKRKKVIEMHCQLWVNVLICWTMESSNKPQKWR